MTQDQLEDALEELTGRIQMAQADVDAVTAQVQQVASDLDAAKTAIQTEVDALASKVASGQPVDLTKLQAAVAPLDSAVKSLGSVVPTPAPAPTPSPVPNPVPATGPSPAPDPAAGPGTLPQVG